MKKGLIISICMLMVFVLLAGCGAPAGETGTPDAEAPQTSDTTDTPEAPETPDEGPTGETKKVANIVAEYNEWNQIFFVEMERLAEEYGWEVETFDAAQDA